MRVTARLGPHDDPRPDRSGGPDRPGGREARRGGRRRRPVPFSGERGSAMMLVPAGFLVLMLFAAIAVDSAGTFLAQRQLTDALAAAANDAATAGLDNTAYYERGDLVLDPGASARVVCRSMAAQGDGDLRDLELQAGVSGPVIAVRGTAEVDVIFGRIIPHFGIRRVTGEATADAQQSQARADGSSPTLSPLDC
jgi:hypothetical protein